METGFFIKQYNSVIIITHNTYTLARKTILDGTLLHQKSFKGVFPMEFLQERLSSFAERKSESSL